MKINASESISDTLKSSASDTVERQARPHTTNSKLEVAKPNSDTSRPPPPPRRPPPVLAHAVTQSLTNAGLGTTNTTAVPGPTPTNSTATANDPENGQSEKISQAMQAFMHSLVQAANTNFQKTNARNLQPDTSQVAGAGPVPTSQTAGEANSPYTGLVSRLESLARQIEGTSPQANGNSTIDELNKAFRNLSGSASTTGDGSEGSPPPKLQEVVRAVARNLQSTGDPTLATSGNVINTSA